MNHCSFFGKIISRKLTSESDTSKVELKILVQKQRRSKSGVSVSDNASLMFEAWDTAADTISHNSTIGDYLLIPNSTVKVDRDRTYFRINEFKIIKNQSLLEN
jgi:hypothetical protein